MNLPRHRLLIAGLALIAIGILLRVFSLDHSDLIFGIGLLLALTSAFLFTYKVKGKEAEDNNK